MGVLLQPKSARREIVRAVEKKETYKPLNLKTMKKVMFLMAVAGMFAFAACNNNKTAEAPAEEAIEEVMVEEEAVAEDAVEAVAEEAAEAAEATEAVAE